MTPKLVKRSLCSILQFYPTIPIIIIDNGSGHDSVKFIKKWAIKRENIRAIMNTTNLGHGAGMHQGIALANTPYVLTFDTDCTLKKPGLVEAMLPHFKKTMTYAVGAKIKVNDFGANVEKGGHKYIHPSVMMLDVAKYNTLPPMIYHGAPCLTNMLHAKKIAGYSLVGFRVQKYVNVEWAGTRKLFGSSTPNWDVGSWRKARPVTKLIKHAETKIVP